MNIRIDEKGRPITSGAQVQIGGNESYISACMEHFTEAVPEMTHYAEMSPLSVK
jgi:thymidine kinase